MNGLAVAFFSLCALATVAGALMTILAKNPIRSAMALLLSLASMIALSYWLTRNLTGLTAAAESLAGGNLDVGSAEDAVRMVCDDAAACGDERKLSGPGRYALQVADTQVGVARLHAAT